MFTLIIRIFNPLKYFSNVIHEDETVLYTYFHIQENIPTLY